MPTNPSLALFPASFDPVTNGHLDLIERAQGLFDEVVVGVATNIDKQGGTFTAQERVAMLEEALEGVSGVRVASFQGLVVEYGRELGARAIIRGLRAMSDFEYEFEMALMNRHLVPETEIIFLMSSLQHLYVSSSRLKELVRFGADIDEFVPACVASALHKKLGL